MSCGFIAGRKEPRFWLLNSSNPVGAVPQWLTFVAHPDAERFSDITPHANVYAVELDQREPANSSSINGCSRYRKTATTSSPNKIRVHFLALMRIS